MENLLKPEEAMKNSITERISELMVKNLQRIESLIATHNKHISSLEKKIMHLETSANFTNDLPKNEKKVIAALVTNNTHHQKQAL